MKTWDSKDSNPIEDIRATREMIEKDTGVRNPISFREALYFDVQNLWMMGYGAKAVEEYVVEMMEAYKRYVEGKLSL